MQPGARLVLVLVAAALSHCAFASLTAAVPGQHQPSSNVQRVPVDLFVMSKCP